MSAQEVAGVIEVATGEQVSEANLALNAKVAALFVKESSLLEVFRENWINPLHMPQEQQKRILHKRNEIFSFLVLVGNALKCLERVRQVFDCLYCVGLQLMEKYNVTDNQVFSTVALLLDIVTYSGLASDQLKNSIHLPLVIFAIACKVCKAYCLLCDVHSAYQRLFSSISQCSP